MLQPNEDYKKFQYFPLLIIIKWYLSISCLADWINMRYWTPLNWGCCCFCMHLACALTLVFFMPIWFVRWSWGPICFSVQGLRPTIPKHTHPKLVELLEKCWKQAPAERPDFSEILQILQHIAKEVDYQILLFVASLQSIGLPIVSIKLF